MAFKPNMLLPADGNEYSDCNSGPIWQQLRLFDRDNQVRSESDMGYNPTFDLWSTAAERPRPMSTEVDQKLVG